MNYSEFIDSLTSSHRSLLSKLTTDGPEQPPGYLYNELVEFIRKDLSKLNEIEEYLINKITRREPYIKVKCLKLLKFLCIKFPKDFIRPKITQSPQILECKNYRAPYADFKSEQLTKTVRSEFEELIKVVCSYDSSSNNSFGTPEDKMVGFGNKDYGQYSQPTSYNSGNFGYAPNPSGQYNPQSFRGMGGYGNTSMMGFGNPNMPKTQPNQSSSFSFPSSLAPTVSDLKNAGNNALKMISNAANKYLPPDLVEKFEKVGNVITSTATEQFEKYLGNRTPLGRSNSASLNNSMYNSRTQSNNSSGYGGGIGYNSNLSNSGPSSGYNPGGYYPPSYNTRQPSISPSAGQPFASFQSQPSFSTVLHSAPSATFSNSASLSSVNPPTVPSLDLFGNQQATSFSNPVSPASKDRFTLPGEVESSFVKEMLTFTGIKVSPSPRLIEEYMERLNHMDKGLVVDELLKHLNVRSSKWQYHFRILCILESLVLKGNLDEKTLTQLRTTAVPIFEKCKAETQLSNKATKLINLLNTNRNVESKGHSGVNTDNLIETDSFDKDVCASDISDVFKNDAMGLFTNKTEPLSNVNPTSLGSKKNTLDPLDSKVNEFDLLFNSDTKSSSKLSDSADRSVNVPNSNLSKQEFKDDFLGLDLSLEKPTPNLKPENLSGNPIISNIDNNLDLFDNVDLSNILDKKTETFEFLQNKKDNFDLI
ncbi:uncharacterized protein TA14670 [Theileria annulata]|uniref:ENTH domain-containing protein n=1 Tax=Theileria annulata TaxID=5874 RepID=Q4UDE3_THEAN|nr:uncharacterized protein TA14670 [Theileria annulata]CAI74896.1 hypothetical protein, conserved [Theileria annulata]|eukprot:XP_952628.1 hypothetical protein, conserved [Theileria annulata]